MKSTQPLDLAAVRTRLEASGGRSYWRSLEELAGTEEFEEMLHREFPRHASEWTDALDRRSFLKLMAASLALAGLSSCSRQPDEKIVPYVKSPEDLVPGKPLYFATASLHDGYALGTLVRSDMGRPTKVEGNPKHPASLGATDIFSQASLLTMYDPDRSRTIMHHGSIRPWEAFAEALVPVLGAQKMLHGAGLRLLSERVTSPSLAAQIRVLLSAYPEACWHQYSPVSRDAELEGARLAFGEPVESLLRFDKANVVVSFDSDFLGSGPASVRSARDFADRRRVLDGKREMNRLYVLESTPSITGTMADHRWPVKASEISRYVRYIAAALGVEAASTVALSEEHRPWLDAIVRDLQSNKGGSIVHAGYSQPSAVHALIHAINAALGNVGKTVEYIDPVEALPVHQGESLKTLVADMEAGKVQVLLVLSGNPVYDAPSDLGFASALEKVDMKIRLGLYEDETSSLSDWHLPESHSLESWSDARAFDGTVSVVQPLVAPLYNSKSAQEVLAMFLGNAEGKGYDVIRSYWQQERGASDFERFWERTLNDGFIEGSAHPLKNVSYQGSGVASALAGLGTIDGIEVVFRPDPTVWDGRYANNGWLQELPKPITKLTWDNAVFMSAATAQKLGVTQLDIVSLKTPGASVEGPVYVEPGHASDSVTLHLGYGRARTGRVGTGTGFNAGAIRRSAGMAVAGGVSVSKTGRRGTLAVTQEHQAMEGRAPIRVATLDEYAAHPHFALEQAPVEAARESLYPGVEYDGYAWGMAIDLNACTGCGACTIACVAENNIPVVGKEGVVKNREMHWIRVDQYFEGDLENPAMHSQPVACVHCENAPCEVVCPVAATVHDHEGLNTMVYNRCVGTRYCSNNCPYKVRRFNFLEYNGSDEPTLKMMHNPDVTVRSRGVMEKCTYCVQRISHARIEAKKDGRTIRDGDVVTACQAACPSQAIVFGNLNDQESRVRHWKQEPRDYGLLAELNTRPRTSYLARLKNPNPDIHEKVA